MALLLVASQGGTGHHWLNRKCKRHLAKLAGSRPTPEMTCDTYTHEGSSVYGQSPTHLLETPLGPLLIPQNGDSQHELLRGQAIFNPVTYGPQWSNTVSLEKRGGVWGGADSCVRPPAV
jgi:hypothetical protein